jgi:hypothetical protein
LQIRFRIKLRFGWFSKFKKHLARSRHGEQAVIAPYPGPGIEPSIRQNDESRIAKSESNLISGRDWRHIGPQGPRKESEIFSLHAGRIRGLEQVRI